MPKQPQFTKEIIVYNAIEIIRENGAQSLTSRNICKRMGCSVSPIFREYANMEELAADVRKAVERRFGEYMTDVTDYNPAFKEMALRMVRFSRLEPNLFHYLFLEIEGRSDAADEVAHRCLAQTEKAFELNREEAHMLFEQLWPFLCGITQLCVKNPDVYSDAKISYMLSVQFQSLLMLTKSGRKVIDIEPKRMEQ